MPDNFTAKELREALSYNPKTGVFMWRYRPEMGKRWNTRYTGKRAGWVSSASKSSKGLPYRKIEFNGKGYAEHRIAWMWMTGFFPSKNIDHKDRNSLNNKWSNLRLATKSQNGANSKACSKTGFKGVYPSGSKFEAQIRVNGKLHSLGTFTTAEEAHTTYMQAARKHFGEFARAE